MNVLVYDGPGVSAVSLAHTLSCMKALLVPHYAVQPVSAAALAAQPWEGACALLVIPGGRDLPYVSALAAAAATARIKSYVERGGAFLGICAGAYFASRRVEWETGTKLEVAGDRPLGFFDGVCRGSVYPGFAYEDERGARAVAVEDAETAEVICGMYHNGGGEFVRAETAPATDVLARYCEGEGSGKTAAVLCRVGKGIAVLWGTHPEYSLFDEPLISALKKREPQLSYEDVKTAEEQRWRLLRRSLTKLGLRLPDNSQGPNNSVSCILPQFLTSSVPGLPTRVFNLLSANATPTIPKILQDNNDTFHLHMSSSAAHILRDARARPGDPGNLQAPKHIIFFLQDDLPLPELTPHFSTREYYSDLSSARASHSLEIVDNDTECGFGELLLYGEVVTSTQTMLDKNPKFLRSLPAPLLSLATHQLSGRGRGTNIWLSPAGCLQFSLLLRPSLSTLPASRLVFIQYLCGLAVVEACRELMGDSGSCVRLKWPNDIYAVVSGVGEDGRLAQEKKKIGGILVNTNFSGGHVDVVIGCGLNVLNGPPMTSLSQLTSRTLTMETTIATIMVVFEEMWRSFVADGGSFERFMDLYLERWLHSDQLVTLTTTSPAPLAVRIVGITPDHGLLRTLPERGGHANEGGPYIDLQPDGNSFDMMAGLIKSKT